jgi:molybdopterin-biosynthesis enzyme MoeA-like protein
MADNNKRQAYIPEDALPLANPAGTAPCFLTKRPPTESRWV